MSATNPAAAGLYDRIQTAIQRLRSLTQATVQGSWHLCMQDIETEQALNPETWTHWPIATLNGQGHIAWPKGRQVLWLGQRFQMPVHLNGYPLTDLLVRLSLTWWAEDSQIFVNGERVQCGDLYDCSARILLQSPVVIGDDITVALRLVSPGHDNGALVKSVMVYEKDTSQAIPEPGFVADELAVLIHYLHTFHPEQLAAIATILDQHPWAQVTNRPAFDGALAHLRQQLLPFSDWIKQRSIQLLGHAHLDLAWLWPIPETWDVAQRTFESALTLQADYPDLIFGHSTPMLYEWMEQHRPDLLSQIQTQIEKGQWEAIAGLWVEPELNLVGGESIVRQVLYGQRYCQEKLGYMSRLAWLPDTFGFCWQLPQILRQGGIDYFITQKLRWNDTTEFPHEWFTWRSPDGTSITSLMSAPIGTTIDPMQMAEYACTWEKSTGHTTCLWLPGVGDHGGGPTRDMIELAHRWQRSPFFPVIEFSTAIDFLDGLRTSDCRLQKMEGIELRSQGSNPISLGSQKHYQELWALTPHPSIQNPKSKIQNPKSKIPLWFDELYLELHRGCYTAHADQKYWNRRCEALLYEAELWSAIATLLTHANYPKKQIEQTWKTVLFNQFHDILPGSSIPAVYADVNPQWETAIAASETMIEQALQTISQTVYAPNVPHRPNPPTPASIPILIYNPLNWHRTDVATIPLPPPLATIHHWAAQTSDGTPLPCQYVPQSSHSQPSQPQSARPQSARPQSARPQSSHLQSSQPHLLLIPPPIPAIGYTFCWLTPLASPPSPHKSATSATSATSADYRLENHHLRLLINPTTGEIQSILDKAQDRSILNGPGNQLLAFKDEGEYWDAWNIAPNYRDHPLPKPILQSIEWIADGPIEQRIRVVRQLGASTFTQDYVLHINSAVVRIESDVEWCDRHTVVKAAFPFSLRANHATYDMPFGAIQRPTHPQTPVEKAKWEVPGLAWADLTAEPSVSEIEANGYQQYGVSILSDYKHGYSATPSELQLTLLRGPTWPDPESDQGHHSFVYAIYPHSESWQAARTVHRSHELHHPLQGRIVFAKGMELPTDTTLGSTPKIMLEKNTVSGSFITIPGEHFVVSAIKQSEDCDHTWIVRGYECHGESGPLAPKNALPRLDPAAQHSIFTLFDVSDVHEKVSILEQPLSTLTTEDGEDLRPWGIHTWAIHKSFRMATDIIAT